MTLHSSQKCNRCRRPLREWNLHSFPRLFWSILPLSVLFLLQDFHSLRHTSDNGFALRQASHWIGSVVASSQIACPLFPGDGFLSEREFMTLSYLLLIIKYMRMCCFFLYRYYTAQKSFFPFHFTVQTIIIIVVPRMHSSQFYSSTVQNFQWTVQMSSYVVSLYIMRFIFHILSFSCEKYKFQYCGCSLTTVNFILHVALFCCLKTWIFIFLHIM